jgi:hypothetical protein
VAAAIRFPASGGSAVNPIQSGKKNHTNPVASEYRLTPTTNKPALVNEAFSSVSVNIRYLVRQKCLFLDFSPGNVPCLSCNSKLSVLAICNLTVDYQEMQPSVILVGRKAGAIVLMQQHGQAI